MEKLICNRLINHLGNHNVLNENQLGFHSGQSNTQQLFSIQTKSKVPLKQTYILVDYFWIQAKNLIQYTTLFVVIAYDWFHSHLTNRQQFVSLDNTFSDTLQVTWGATRLFLDHVYLY